MHTLGDWVTNAIADDQELVMSMLEPVHTNDLEPTKLDGNALDLPTTSCQYGALTLLRGSCMLSSICAGTRFSDTQCAR